MRAASSSRRSTVWRFQKRGSDLYWPAIRIRHKSLRPIAKPLQTQTKSVGRVSRNALASYASVIAVKATQPRSDVLPAVRLFSVDHSLVANCQSKIYNLQFSRGVLAQLVERLNGIEEVTGSNPVGSTPFYRGEAKRTRDFRGGQSATIFGFAFHVTVLASVPAA